MAKPTLASQIDRYLKSYGSPMAGLGEQFVKAGARHGVDPRLIVGIGVIESSAGKHMKNPYNFANWGVHMGTKYTDFGSAIDALAKGLNRGYISQGLKTPGQIVTRYAPSADGNNEAHWARTVSSVMSQVGSGTGWTQRSPTNSPGTPALTAAKTMNVPDFTEEKRKVGVQGLVEIASGADPTQSLNTMTQGLTQLKEMQKRIATIKTPTGQPDVPVMADAGTPAASNGAKGIVALAKQYLGVPYVWGGTTPKGFDCSGFLQFVWAKQGVQIPRVSQQQFDAGKAVSRKNLRPGDAVFFHMGKDGPGHVGMYIGNGQFIQAPHTGDVVKISKLDGYGGYVGARRFGV